jgi:hypothetical protein
MEQLKVLTIITESVLENSLVKEIEDHGAHGYTITDARGKGHRGLRDGGWDYNSNIRIEVICTEIVCEGISSHLQDKYYDDYAMISFTHDVTVLRSNKF